MTSNKSDHNILIEIEVKFIVPNRDTFNLLKSSKHFGDFQLQFIGTKVHIDRYLDTVDKRLLQAGYACRIRSVKSRQIFTMKSLTPPQGNVHRRQEFEVEINSGRPQSWPKSAATDLVLDIIGDELLHPLFTLYQTRHKYEVVAQGDALIEFSLDEVSFNNSDEVDYFELEAELLPPGTEEDLTHFINALQSAWQLTPQHQSKFERALDYFEIGTK